MKNLLIAGLVLITGCGKKPLPKIGQPYQGGRIFYIDSSDYHGLVIDTEDLGILNWEDAINKCKSYRAGGFNDWHLPTLKELDLLYQHKDTADGFIHYYYWSGEELTNQEDDDSAYYKNFSDGTNGKANEGNQNMVRAVRAF